MPSVRIFDENSNQYLSEMFFRPLEAYCRDRGMDIARTSDPLQEQGKIILAHGDRCPPERILQFKERNKLVIFDINDSSYFSSSYTNTPAQHEIDLIFKISGVPKRNLIKETNLTREFNVVLSDERFLPDEQWEEFNKIRMAGKIKSLPYVLWHDANRASRPNRGDRSGRVMVRGGNHFWRVVLFLHLLKDGILDYQSSFITEPYFQPWMEKRFMFCDECIQERNVNGRALFDAPLRHKSCTNPATCWHMEGEMFGGPMYGKHEHGWWNNRCPHSFFHLAKEFERCKEVALDHAMIERALNGRHVSQEDFFNDLGRTSFYADLKWLNTINLPPRFWEAASVGTPSLYAKRVSDQDYWPKVEEDVHYYTYPEDMSSFGTSLIPQAHWNEVSRAVRDIYETKIKGTQYAVSNALLEHMTQSILEIA